MSLIWLLASGVPYFAGAALVGLAGAWPRSRRRFVGCLAWAGMILGLMLIVLSATPDPPWLRVAGGLAVLVWAIARVTKNAGRKRPIGKTVRCALPALAVLAILLEAPHHRMASLPSGRETRLIVLGDSLSADQGRDWPGWPTLRANQHGIVVENLSVGGATAAAGRAQADAATGRDGVVVIALGGNDILRGGRVEEFQAGLEYILRTVRGDGRRLVMLELPLPPLYDRFGHAQRRLAERYGVTLVPKRHLAAVLARRDATTDGIHLTPAGQAALAEKVWKCIGPAFGGR